MAEKNKRSKKSEFVKATAIVLATEYEQMLREARMDIMMDEMITNAIIHEVYQAGTALYSTQRMEPSADPICIPKSADDISLFHDNEYWSFFHMSRRTVKSISEYMEIISSHKKGEKKIKKGSPNNEVQERFSFKVLLEIVLWYLSSSERLLTDGVRLFNLRSQAELEEALDRGLTLLLDHREHAAMGWYQEEYEGSANQISKEFKVKNICGLMVNKIFTALDRRRLVLHVVCDSNRLFKDTVVTYDTRPKVALVFTEKFSANLLKTPPEFKILCSSEYGFIQSEIRKVIVTPETFPERLLDTHNTLLNVAEDSVLNMCKRFPRLNKLYFNDPKALLAGCVLYNYSLLLKDLPPLV